MSSSVKNSKKFLIGTIEVEIQVQPQLKIKILSTKFDQHMKESTRQLEEYFSGKRRMFDLPLESKGTAFQKKVWQATANIPFGETRTYADIAKEIGHPKAVRAVGTALGKNPVAIIVPCHRVIASNGKLGGYAWGIEMKKKLLEYERMEKKERK